MMEMLLLVLVSFAIVGASFAIGYGCAKTIDLISKVLDAGLKKTTLIVLICILHIGILVAVISTLIEIERNIIG